MMTFATKYLAALAVLALTPLGACASEGAPTRGPVPYASLSVAAPPSRLTEAHDGLLSSPPNNARPGECYAKVVLPGQRIGPPPAQPSAVWRQTPPGPGQVSPTWCLYYLPGAPAGPVAMTPERFGWIRVICDRDATEEKIRHVQHRLHDWGVYDGPYDGHFSDTTAHGVARFQDQRHIEHGGYLSFKTMDALDGAPPPPPAPAPMVQGYPPTFTQAAYAAPCAAACAPVAPQVVYAPPAPPPPPQVIYAPAPPPQIVVQRVIQPVYIQQQQPVYMQPQPVYAPAPVYAQAPVYAPPVYAPQAGCGQPACAPVNPCGGPVCGAPGGPQWGGAYGPQGTPPYRALLTWPGKSTY